ncbi:MAG: ribosome recycling factor [bacterium]|jgi:ribosome recycling factor
MGVPEILRETENRMKKSLEAANSDFATLRTGRANPTLLDSVKAEYYGSPTPLNQLGQITVSEGRTLVIAPYDRTALAAIEKAILKSNLGLQPINDGVNVRVNIPPLTEERRKDLVKQLAQKVEGARVSLRNIRRDAIEQFKKDEEVTDDDAKRAEKDVQKLLDRHFAELDVQQKAKEAELLEV